MGHLYRMSCLSAFSSLLISASGCGGNVEGPPTDDGGQGKAAGGNAVGSGGMVALPGVGGNEAGSGAGGSSEGQGGGNSELELPTEVEERPPEEFEDWWGLNETCECEGDHNITVQWPSGTKEYPLATGFVDGCSQRLCRPEAAFAGSWGAPSRSTRIDGCNEEGDCISIGVQVLSLSNGGKMNSTWGVVLPGEQSLRMDIESDIDEDWSYGLGSNIEFSFTGETSEGPVSGSGNVCVIADTYLCLK